MTRKWRFVPVQLLTCLILLLVLLSPGQGAPPALAQSSGIAWSRPLNLSASPSGSSHPAIVADSYGLVHVFWSEDMGGPAMLPDDPLPTGNSIFYSQRNGDTWTPPVDVLSVPDDAVADFVSVAVDPDNNLHVVWTGQSNFYYSTASSPQAYSARAWTKPIVIASDSARSSWPISIATSGSGLLHVVYATRGSEPGVYYIRGENGAANWDAPVKLSAELDALETSFANVRIVADTADRLHVVWQTDQREGYGQAIYYAHSQDDGKSWSTPVQLAYRGPLDFDVGWPFLVVKGKSELHLIYNAGSRPIGRYHRISLDGGETWGGAEQIIPELEGINGYVVSIIDGSDQLHLIIDMRTRATQVVGLYYSRWSDNAWSPALPIATDSPYGPSAHYTAAAVRLGNEIDVVWTELDVGEIWYMQGVVPGVAAVPARPIEVSGILADATPAPTVQALSRPTATRQGIALVDSTPMSSSALSTGTTSLFSIGIPALVVLAGFLWAWIQIKERS